jgi:aquaporin NIP
MSKKSLAMLVAELVGTFVLAIVVLSVNRYGLPIFTAATAGVAIAMMYTAVGSSSGGHFNPAITLGFLSLRKISFVRALSFVASQAVGAVLAWKLYEWFVDKTISLAVTEFDWKVFVAEMLGALIFSMAIAAVVMKKLDGYLAAVTIGSGFFLGATLASLVASAGALNPAVSISLGFRPENVGYLAYFFGPVIGAVVGMNFYRYAFADGRVSVARKSAPVVVAASARRSSTAKKTAAKRKPAARRKK